MSSKHKSQRNPPDIAKVHFDNDVHAWNTVVEVDEALITLAAVDKDHAKRMADDINAACWVSVERVKVRS